MLIKIYPKQKNLNKFQQFFVVVIQFEYQCRQDINIYFWILYKKLATENSVGDFIATDGGIY